MDAIEIIRTKDYERNEARVPVMEQPCFRCGRKVRPDGAYVHLRTDGLVAPADAILASNEDQGWFPIGPECAKSIPAKFRRAAV